MHHIDVKIATNISRWSCDKSDNELVNSLLNRLR